MNDHATRIARIAREFGEAAERLAARLERADDRAARTRPADGGWSAAQVAWHVAAVNGWFARVVETGDGARPPAAGFVERDWRDVVAGIPSLPGGARRDGAAGGGRSARGPDAAQGLQSASRRRDRRTHARPRGPVHSVADCRDDLDLSGWRVGDRAHDPSQPAGEAGARRGLAADHRRFPQINADNRGASGGRIGVGVICDFRRRAVARRPSAGA